MDRDSRYENYTYKKEQSYNPSANAYSPLPLNDDMQYIPTDEDNQILVEQQQFVPIRPVQSVKSRSWITPDVVAKMIILVIVAAAAAGIIVSQHEQIAQINSSNNAIMQEITLNNDLYAKLQVGLSVSIDLDTVINKATQRGMLSPSHEQIVEVDFE